MTKPKKVKVVRTRPNYAQQEFLNTIQGTGGGQWGAGFFEGVAAFTRFLNTRRAVINYSPPKK